MKLLFNPMTLELQKQSAAGLPGQPEKGRLLALDYFPICQQLHFP